MIDRRSRHYGARKRLRLAIGQRSGRFVALALVVLAAAACGPRAGNEATVTPGMEAGPGDGPPPEGTHEGGSAGELKQRLDRYSTQQDALVSGASTDVAVCEDLCALSTNICAVQEELCKIADDHPGDNDYQALCREAQQECREARESCERCVQSNSR